MQQVTVAQGGRIVIPAKIRKQLELSEGDQLECEVENGVLTLMTRKQKIRRALKHFHERYPPDPDRSLVDELISERRAEAVKEDE